MKQYSFTDSIDRYQSIDNSKKRLRKRMHIPQSRETAHSNTLGSYASITSTGLNNVYNQESNN